MMRARTRDVLGRTLLLTLIGGLCAAGSCGDGGDPDGDDRRGRSKEINIGQVVTDSITPPVDSVDWKIINVPGGGFLTVNVFWDKSEVDSIVSLVDKFGRTLEEEVRDKRSPSDEIIVSAPEEGFYFIKIEGRRGESVYSVQTSFSQDSSIGLGPEDEPIPEFVKPIEPGSEGDEVKPKGGGGGGGGGGGPSLTPLSGGGGGGFSGDSGAGAAVFNAGGGAGNDVGRPSATRTDLVPDIQVPFNAVDAQIMRVVPKGTGGCEIILNVGTNNGVQKNHVGEIILSSGQRLEGGRFIVQSVSSRSATVETNAPANMVGAANKAIVKVPR